MHPLNNVMVAKFKTIVTVITEHLKTFINTRSHYELLKESSLNYLTLPSLKVCAANDSLSQNPLNCAPNLDPRVLANGKLKTIEPVVQRPWDLQHTETRFSIESSTFAKQMSKARSLRDL